MKNLFIYFKKDTGKSYHRLKVPYTRLQELYPQEFNVTIETGTLSEEKIMQVAQNYDFFIYNTLIPEDYLNILKNEDIITICDIDDYWHLNDKHLMKLFYTKENLEQKVLNNIKAADYVTTTTGYLENKILPFNPRVEVFENAVNFQPFKHNETDRVRIGLISGSSHIPDMELLKGLGSLLDQDTLDKIQIVLCGFSSGVTIVYSPNGDSKVVETPWEDMCWAKWEKELTNNYKTLTPEYADDLRKYMPINIFPLDEPYRRIWGTSTDKYNFLYDEIDLLLIPLVDCEFNRCKSALKIAEAASKEVGIICSDVPPYSPYLKDCQKVNNQQKAKGFAKAIKKYLNTEDKSIYIPSKDFFNLDAITAQRRDWLNMIYNTKL